MRIRAIRAAQSGADFLQTRPKPIFDAKSRDISGWWRHRRIKTSLGCEPWSELREAQSSCSGSKARTQTPITNRKKRLKVVANFDFGLDAFGLNRARRIATSARFASKLQKLACSEPRSQQRAAKATRPVASKLELRVAAVQVATCELQPANSKQASHMALSRLDIELACAYPLA